MGSSRGKPGAAMPARMAREGMPSTGPGPMGSGSGKPRAAMSSAGSPMGSSRAMGSSRGAPGGPGYSSTPNYMPSSAQIARNKQEGASRANAMSPMDRLSQNAPKFKG
jgi:hypothetical protein